MKWICLFLVFLIFTNCNDKKELEEFYSSGNLKNINFSTLNQSDSVIGFYDLPNNVLKCKKIFENDYTLYHEYYKNGKLFRKGKFSKNENKFNRWYYYNQAGYLSDVREYMFVNNEVILNQIWYFNNKGDTVKIRSNEFNQYGDEFSNKMVQQKYSHFIKILIPKDTISLEEPFTSLIFHSTPLSTYHNGSIKIYVDNEKTPFNDDFSNLIEVREFSSLKEDTINQKSYPNDKTNYNYMSAFGQFYDTPGNKILKGFVAEIITDTVNKVEIKERVINKVYFKIPLYVKN